MRTTLVLNDKVQKFAKIKALKENLTLSQVVNELLEFYVNDNINIKQSTDLLDKLETTDLGIKSELVDRDMIYELK